MGYKWTLKIKNKTEVQLYRFGINGLISHHHHHNHQGTLLRMDIIITDVLTDDLQVDMRSFFLASAFTKNTAGRVSCFSLLHDSVQMYTYCLNPQ